MFSKIEKTNLSGINHYETRHKNYNILMEKNFAALVKGSFKKKKKQERIKANTQNVECHIEYKDNIDTQN